MKRSSNSNQYRRAGIATSFEEACLVLGIEPRVGNRRNPGGFSYLRAIGKSRGSGRVTFYSPDRTSGNVFNLTTGEYCLFFADKGRKLSRAEREARERADELQRRITAEQTAKRHARTAEKARKLLAAARPADGNPYLTRKLVRPVGSLRQVSGRELYSFGFFSDWRPFREDEMLLLVPVSFGGEVVNLQVIPERGTKLSLPDGKLGGGCVWLSEPLPEESDAAVNIGLAEGVATILSVVEAFGEADIRIVGACSFGCSNLRSAAVRLRDRFPRASLVVFGDLGNGSESARDASEALCGDRDRLVRFPEFTEEELELYRAAHDGKDPTDFNDKAMLVKAKKTRKGTK